MQNAWGSAVGGMGTAPGEQRLARLCEPKGYDVRPSSFRLRPEEIFRGEREAAGGRGGNHRRDLAHRNDLAPFPGLNRGRMGMAQSLGQRPDAAEPGDDPAVVEARRETIGPGHEHEFTQNGYTEQRGKCIHHKCTVESGRKCDRGDDGRETTEFARTAPWLVDGQDGAAARLFACVRVSALRTR